jgi:hypothetical protein
LARSAFAVTSCNLTSNRAADVGCHDPPRAVKRISIPRILYLCRAASLCSLGDALMLETFCTFAHISLVVSIVWPDRRSDRAADERKHKEVLQALDRLERQNTPPPSPPPLPTFNSAEQARVLALGKIRASAKRHPILDTPWVSVANPPERRTRSEYVRVAFDF